MTKFTREVKFVAAYDKRHKDPLRNYGVHGVHIYFWLRADNGEGLSFSVSTNWQLPSVDTTAWDADMHKPMAFSVDIHSTKPRYEGQVPQKSCEVTGGLCYSDGSGLLGEEFLAILIAGGDEALWKRMEEQYLQWSTES